MFGDDGCRRTCSITARLYGCDVDPQCRKGMYCECNEVYHFQKRDVPADKFSALSFNELWNYRFQQSPQSATVQNLITEDNNMKNYAESLLRDPHMTGEEIKTTLSEQYPQLRQLRDLPSVDTGEKNHIESSGNDFEYNNLGEYFAETLQSWRDRARAKVEECRYKRNLMNLLNNVEDEGEIESIKRQVLMSGNETLYNFLNSYLRKREGRGRRRRGCLRGPGPGMSPWGRGGYRRKPIKKTIILKKGEKPITIETDEDEIIEVTVINNLLNDNKNGQGKNSGGKIPNVGDENSRKPSKAPGNALAQDMQQPPLLSDQLQGDVMDYLPYATANSPTYDSWRKKPSVTADIVPGQNLYNPLQASNTLNSFVPSTTAVSPSPLMDNTSMGNLPIDYSMLQTPSQPANPTRLSWPNTPYSFQSVNPSGVPWMSTPYSFSPYDQSMKTTGNGQPVPSPNITTTPSQNQLPSWMNYIPAPVLPYMYGNMPPSGNGYAWSPTIPQMNQIIPSSPAFAQIPTDQLMSISQPQYDSQVQKPSDQPMSATQPLRLPSQVQNISDQPMSINQLQAIPDQVQKTLSSLPMQNPVLDQPYSYSYSFSSGDNSNHSDSNSNSAGSRISDFVGSPGATIDIPNPVIPITDLANDYAQQGMSYWTNPAQLTDAVNGRISNNVPLPMGISSFPMETTRLNMPSLPMNEIQNPQLLNSVYQQMYPTTPAGTWESMVPNYNAGIGQSVPGSSFIPMAEMNQQTSTPTVVSNENSMDYANRDVTGGAGPPPNLKKKNNSMFYLVVEDGNVK